MKHYDSSSEYETFRNGTRIHFTSQSNDSCRMSVPGNETMSGYARTTAVHKNNASEDIPAWEDNPAWEDQHILALDTWSTQDSSAMMLSSSLLYDASTACGDGLVDSHISRSFTALMTVSPPALNSALPILSPLNCA